MDWHTVTVVLWGEVGWVADCSQEYAYYDCDVTGTDNRIILYSPTPYSATFSASQGLAHNERLIRAMLAGIALSRVQGSREGQRARHWGGGGCEWGHT